MNPPVAAPAAPITLPEPGVVRRSGLRSGPGPVPGPGIPGRLPSEPSQPSGPSGKRGRRRSRSDMVRLLGVIGPAFVAAVAFVDPGNVGTNVSAGAGYGYLLVWTVIAASLMAMFVQYLSAKLGLATGQSLSEVCREHTSTPVRIGLWLVAEAVVIMTDLAEFVGGALALNLLFGLPLVVGGLIVAVLTTMVLGMRLRGHDVFPWVVVGLLFVVAAGFVALAVRAPFRTGAAASGLIPHLDDQRSLLLAAGIVGATVMPHAVFLHSALAGRFAVPGRRTIRTKRVLRFLRRDVIIAMSLAGAVNVSMLLMATSLPSGTGNTLEQVHAAIANDSGELMAIVFAVALLASGLASSCAGVFSGQTIMRGFLHRKSNIWVRRAISIVPALFILSAVDPTGALVFSQVALSFGLPFALIPLVIFTSRSGVMGALVNQVPTVVFGVLVTLVVLVLNCVLLLQTAGI